MEKDPNDVLEVWQKKWGTRADIEKEREAGVLYIEVSRLEKDLTDLYQKGLENGRLEGRSGMRKDIETGKIPEIHKLEGNEE